MEREDHQRKKWQMAVSDYAGSFQGHTLRMEWPLSLTGGVTQNIEGIHQASDREPGVIVELSRQIADVSDQENGPIVTYLDVPRFRDCNCAAGQRLACCLALSRAITSRIMDLASSVACSRRRLVLRGHRRRRFGANCNDDTVKNGLVVHSTSGYGMPAEASMFVVSIRDVVVSSRCRAWNFGWVEWSLVASLFL